MALDARPQSLSVLYVGGLPPHPGGAAISAAGLLTGLAALGHTVRALAPLTPESSGSDGGWLFADRHARVSRFAVSHYDITADIPATSAYRRGQRDAIRTLLPAMIAAEPPDVLFVGRETFVVDVADIARAHAIPCLLRLPGSVTYGLLRGTYSAGLARELLAAGRTVQRMVAPARHLAARARVLGWDDVVVIPNAVDTERFAPRPKNPALLRQHGIPDTALVVAHLSNLKPIKQPLDVVASARAVLPQDPRLVYLILGDGPARRPMEDACQQAGIQDRVRFTGWVDYPRVPDYINLADLVVMPSADEGLARVYLETQACGRVLLASDIPAAREVVVDGQTGLLFRAGDLADLTATTLRAAADAPLRAAIGRQARQHIEDQHRLPDAVARYAALLAELAREHRPTAAGVGPMRGR
jgi:glycosyltransferase involved in cell wall biosynthesis